MKGSADIEFLASLEQDINQSLAILVAAEKGECSLNNDFDVEDILGADIDYEEEIRKMMPVDLLDGKTLPKRNPITSPDDLSNAIVYLTARFDLLKITTQPPAVSIPSATDDIVLPSPPTNSKSNRPRFRRLKVMGRTCLVTKSDR